MNTLWNELDGGRLLSPALWQGLAPPVGGTWPQTLSGNPAIGLFDDLVGFGRCCPASSGLAYYTSNGIGYRAFEDDDGSITALVPGTTGPGIIKLTAGNTDNDDCSIQAGGGSMMPFNVICATAKDLAFECRMKYSSIADGDTDFFIGLFGTGGAVNNGWLSDNPSGVIATDMANNDFLGFTRTPSTGTSGIILAYDRVGGTTGTKSSVHTLVADTWVKLGFRWNSICQTLDIYADGVLVQTVAKSVCAATPWPTLYMNFLAGVKYQATTQDVMHIDWWACAQYL